MIVFSLVTDVEVIIEEHGVQFSADAQVIEPGLHGQPDVLATTLTMSAEFSSAP